MKNESLSSERSGHHLPAGIAAILIWSTSFVSTKLAYASFPPLTLGACRFIIALALLAVVRAMRGDRLRPDRASLGLLALSGFLGITMYFAMENIGVSLTSASNAAIICASYPAITIVLERLIYKMPLTGRKSLGVGLAMAGVWLVAGMDGGASGEDSRLWGNVILFATGFVWAFYNFVTKRVVNRFPALTVSFYQTLFGAAAFIPLACLEYRNWQMPSGNSFAVLLYLGTFCSVAAYMLYNYGLRKLSAGAAVTLINLVPVFGVLLSVLVLHEDLYPMQILGGLIVIVGVVISVRR